MEETISTPEIRENKMGTMPVGKLLMNMSLPIIISMIVQAMYNIIDSIFVAQINENALTSVSLAFPIQCLMIAVGAGTGVGINALLSRSLGEKNFDRANKTAVNGIFIVALSYIAFAVFGLFFSDLFFKTQSTDMQIIQYGDVYLAICCTCSIGLFMQMTFERLLQATGKTFYTMITQGTGAIINIILDPILIFGLLGAPKLGIAGAAIATIIGQCIGAGLAIYFNFTKNHDIHISFKKFRPDFHIIKTIYQVGIPSIIMQSIGSIMTYGMNKILMGFSGTAVSVFGVYFKLQSFIFMPVFGLNNGFIPIVAYNYGAKNKKRITDVTKIAVGIAVTIMLIGLAVFQLFPDKLLMLFNASDDMIAIGKVALRTISLSFIFAGFCIIVGSVFQALGNGMYSLIISFARQIVIILPAAYILSKTVGLDGVWFAIPLAEIGSVLLTVLFFKQIYNDKIKALK
ncbi:MATE family efflux transporter [uncultured Clostridium sp.]|uniref:MATE family efflux transporter n=1 Tax=uncultured Clostridium sp. TaxID=59620 RepID=UPI0025DB0D6B|nr:MATE family efflux transporter [uncultured Clostridium sp.]